MQFLLNIVKGCESRGISRPNNRVSRMELFAEKVNELQPPITFEKSSILDVSEYVLNTECCSEYASGSVNYFRKKLHLRCLTGF